MSALRQLASLAPRRFQTTALPIARRHASTAPHYVPPPQYTLKERLVKFVPVESYPLIVFVICMSTFGITWGIRSFTTVPGDLRLHSSRVKKAEDERKPWEDPRALEGKW
ncbi:hypothetical protein JCM10207_004968 [Rhodosporidiobolus poonsookiae]